MILSRVILSALRHNDYTWGWYALVIRCSVCMCDGVQLSRHFIHKFSTLVCDQHTWASIAAHDLHIIYTVKALIILLLCFLQSKWILQHPQDTCLAKLQPQPIWKSNPSVWRCTCFLGVFLAMDRLDPFQPDATPWAPLLWDEEHQPAFATSCCYAGTFHMIPPAC